MRAIASVLIVLGSVAVLSTAARADAAGRAPTVEDKRPVSNLIVGSAYPQIYARFADGSSAVNPASVRLTVDGSDVTGASTISSAYVSYVPQSAMDAGHHTVSVSGLGDDGIPFSDDWSFRVDPGSFSDINSMFSSGPGYYGYPTYGFYPRGFSLFTPGPIFIFAGGIVEVVFFSPYFPYGNGFVTIGGIPGQFFLTPWYGCPGYYWASVRVPYGIRAHDAIMAAHFTTSSGKTVVVHSTAPLQIDATMHGLPASVRYANQPVLISRPISPWHMVRFTRATAAAAFTPPEIRRAPNRESWPLLVGAPPPPVQIPAPGQTRIIFVNPPPQIRALPVAPPVRALPIAPPPPQMPVSAPRYTLPVKAVPQH